ncbi:hypothetical protein ACNOYE_12960 [Nannocystaceae bacterium ST9]
MIRSRQLSALLFVSVGLASTGCFAEHCEVYSGHCNDDVDAVEDFKAPQPATEPGPEGPLYSCGDGMKQGGEACDDANQANFDTCNDACEIPAPPELDFVPTPIKQFEFGWSDDPNATHYQLLERPEGVGSFQLVDGVDIIDIIGSTKSLTVPLHLREHASYMLRACDEFGCLESDPLSVESSTPMDAVGYFKPTNVGVGNRFGAAMALSGDGGTLAVAASNEASGRGAVHVFRRGPTNQWTQVADLEASDPDVGDHFGSSLALSEDGTTLAIGARLGDGGLAGVAVDAGAVYVFTRDEREYWQETAYLSVATVGAGEWFGASVSLSAAGDLLAVGAPGSAIGGEIVEAEPQAGAVHVFRREGEDWWQLGYVVGSNTNAGDQFGTSVALSGDGSVLAVGAPQEDSGADSELDTGAMADESAQEAGAVYVFRWSTTTWEQRAYLKASNSSANDRFGTSVALSHDGNTLAIGAPQEDGDDEETGAVYVQRYDLNAYAWEQVAHVKATDAAAHDDFGSAVQLSDDGQLLAVGAHGVEGDEGAVYVHRRTDSNAWEQLTYVKAPNAEGGDRFGCSVALSSDGNTLAVGADLEDSSANEIGGDPSNDWATDAGAVYLY